jgi:hypothetical protein
VNGSQLFDLGSSSLVRVISSASGGSGRSVSRFSMRRMGPPWRPPVSSAAAATRSIPKPPIGRIRSARLITGPSLLRVWPRHNGGLLLLVLHPRRGRSRGLIEAKIILGYDPPGLLKNPSPEGRPAHPPGRHVIPVGRSACGTLTLFTLAGAAPCLTPSTPASSIAPAGRRSQSGVHGPADSSRFWPTEHCTSYLPTSSCGGWVINRRCRRRRR